VGDGCTEEHAEVETGPTPVVPVLMVTVGTVGVTGESTDVVVGSTATTAGRDLHNCTGTPLPVAASATGVPLKGETVPAACSDAANGGGNCDTGSADTCCGENPVALATFCDPFDPCTGGEIFELLLP
jgi:hypothetical protein